MIIKIHRALLFIFFVIVASGCEVPGEDVEVMTTDGLVVGKDLGNFQQFYSIPFAQPPTGALRWLPPQPVSPWQGKRLAYWQSPWCKQTISPVDIPGTSEDCLYLNVWRPNTEGPHPVMVWIHGGALLAGSANQSDYNGATLAEQQNVVVVSLNYRLGYYGFLTLDQGDGENAALVTGNQGFLDQLAALQWVKRNINQFGGDSSNITIFGESAGAISACYLLASPLTDGLFNRAILQSGSCKALPLRSQEKAQQQGKQFLADLGCDTSSDPLACARAKSATEINQILDIELLGFLNGDFSSTEALGLPAIDNAFLPDEIDQLLTSNTKPLTTSLLIGTNADEGSLFTALIQKPANDDLSGYRDLVETLLPGSGDTLTQQYPLADFADVSEAIKDIFSDVAFNCPSRNLADIWSASRSVYFYHFTQQVSGGIKFADYFLDNSQAGLGTFHASEIPYVFGRNSLFGNVQTIDQRETQAAMMAYWGNFARTGNPNGDTLAEWPLYSEADPEHLILNQDFQTGSDLRDEYCAFLDENPTYLFR